MEMITLTMNFFIFFPFVGVVGADRKTAKC